MKYHWKRLITREGVDITSISALDKVFIDCTRLINKRIREPFFTVIKDKTLTHYLCVDELEVGRKIYRTFFKDIKKAKSYYTEGNSFIIRNRKKVNYWKKFAKANSYQWQIKALNDFMLDFDYVNYRFSIWPWWGIESWQVDSENILGKLIKKRRLEARYEEIMASIYKSWRTTAITRLQSDLHNNLSITKLIAKYQFLRSWSAIWYRPIDKKWIQQFKNKKISGNKIKILSKSELYHLLKPSQLETYHINLAPYIIFFKDFRDDVRRQYVYSWSFLFDDIAARFGIDRNDLGYLGLDELRNTLLKNKFPFNTVRYRIKYSTIVVTGNGFTLKTKVIDKKINKYLQIITQLEKRTKKVITLKGLSAYMGIAKGQVRIIKSYHDIKRVKEGDILVTNTTHPNYIPAMYKAAAFVTNEGGVASHAAIVARELKKPCIVGTQIATEVLKDGDKVEVDANKGIITILINY